MSEALYERYKDALRRGHVAVSRGRHDVALDAYGEASRLAPDRAMPYVGIGNVLTRVGRDDDALAAYDAALDRAPGDEAALRGRADLLEKMGDAAGAATALDRLAGTLEMAGRPADAIDAARRALELAESRGRRTAMHQMAERLGAGATDPATVAAYDAALRLFDRSAPGELVEERPPEPPPPPFLPGAATALVEDAAASGDAAATVARALEAAAGHRANGSIAAAIDACYFALAAAPADPDLHLTLVDLYLDRGWRTLAADKLVLLDRLADLGEDATTRARICGVAAQRLPDEERLTATCR